MTSSADEVLTRLVKKENAIRVWIAANTAEIERIGRYTEEADLYAAAAAEIRRLRGLLDDSAHC
jgi:hypothetical protein